MSLYQIKFYADKNGNKPVLNYLQGLLAKGDKDSRIKANKIKDYLDLLKEFGISLGEPYLTHSPHLKAGDSAIINRYF